MHLSGENPKIPAPRTNPSALHLTDAPQGEASESLLRRLLELDSAGLTSEDIAAQVLTAEPENAAFRAAMLVEIILKYARQEAKERDQ